MASIIPEPKPSTKKVKVPHGTFFVIAFITFPLGLVLGYLIFGTLTGFAILNPYLLFIYFPIIYLVYRYREKNRREALKKDGIKGLIFSKNKFDRFLVNVLFILFWWRIWMFFYDIYDWDRIDYDEFFRFCLIGLLLYAPIFFYTRFLWFEKSRSRTFYGLFAKLKFNLKQFNSEVFNTTSNADELKKYADLRDQGIITEEEFQAKKKMLLDL